MNLKHVSCLIRLIQNHIIKVWTSRRSQQWSVRSWNKSVLSGDIHVQRWTKPSKMCHITWCETIFKIPPEIVVKGKASGVLVFLSFLIDWAAAGHSRLSVERHLALINQPLVCSAFVSVCLWSYAHCFINNHYHHVWQVLIIALNDNTCPKYAVALVCHLSASHQEHILTVNENAALSLGTFLLPELFTVHKKCPPSTKNEQSLLGRL